MIKEAFELEEKKCFAYGSDEPQYLLLQPEGERGQAPEKQPELISSLTDLRFLYIAFTVENWNRDLSPWKAPPVFGNEPFGEGAALTLAFIREKLLPHVRSAYGIGADLPVILGGYSLGAFFALWCAFQTDTFRAVAAASPSVWFPGWIEYASAHDPSAGYIFLSLGDREEKTRNKTLSAVGDCIRTQKRLLDEKGIDNCLEWNPGNHFMDPELRCARAFARCMDVLKEQSHGDN